MKPKHQSPTSLGLLMSSASSRSSRCAAILLLAFASLSSAARSGEAIKLDGPLFEVLEPMGMFSNPDAYPEWQEISINFREKEPTKFLFPARALVERITAKRPSGESRVPAIHFERIEVKVFRSTSYFSLIYNVEVTLKGAGKGEWFFVAGFRGKRNRDYLKSTEAQQQICSAIVECLRGIDRTGGFLP